MNPPLLDRLPDWMRSVRFRLTVYYSTALFLLATLLVGALYFALHRSLQEEFVAGQYRQVRPVLVQELTGETRFGTAMSLQEFERRVNQHTLDNLRRYSFGALAALFFVSLGVGYVVSGRVLAPIGSITEVARRIQATDLSRRIDLEGPKDELKALADTFDGMLARLDAAFAAQREFIADASHELRNPLAVIRTNLDVALSARDPDAGELREAVLAVRRATDRMSALVDDLLALARLDAREAAQEVVDLAGVAREIADELGAIAATRRVELVLRGTGAVVVGDRAALRRALANLVDNALRYAPDGSAVEVSVGRRPGEAFMEVADRGPGIPPEFHDRVFDRFWRADRARSRAEGGTGLGLAIVRRVAESHGGRVELDSAPGAGSRFRIVNPAGRGEGG